MPNKIKKNIQINYQINAKLHNEWESLVASQSENNDSEYFYYTKINFSNRCTIYYHDKCKLSWDAIFKLKNAYQILLIYFATMRAL